MKIEIIIICTFAVVSAQSDYEYDEAQDRRLIRQGEYQARWRSLEKPEPVSFYL